MQTSMYLELVENMNDRLPRHGGVFFLPYAEDHLVQISMNQPDVASAMPYVDVIQMVSAQARLGPSVTAFIGAKPVTCFGAYRIWSGMGEAWMISDDAARYRPIQMTKAARYFIDIVSVYLALHRLQITVKNSDKRALRWATALGFESEGLLKKFGPDGSDFFMMARTT